MKSDIFVSIRKVATGVASAADIDDVLRQVRSAIGDEQAWRVEFEAAAINPLVDTAEAQRAQEEIAASGLKERRLEAALALLEPRLAEARETERQAALLPAWEALKQQRDTLLKNFRREYAQHAAFIASALQRMKELDLEIGSIETPKGCESIDTFMATLSRRFVDLVRLPELGGGGMHWGDDPTRVKTMGELINLQPPGRGDAWAA